MDSFSLLKVHGTKIKKNIEKFDEDFRFQITREELDDLVRSKNFTSQEESMFQSQSGGTRYLPWCFTESGVYMLIVIKTDIKIHIRNLCQLLFYLQFTV